MLILEIDVNEYSHPVTSHEIGLARDPLTSKLLREQYAPKWFSVPPKSSRWRADLSGTPAFQHYVRKYSEVVLNAPWDDIVLYFDQSAMVTSAVGRTPLAFPPSYPLLNSAAMAMAAEAVAGWYCESTHPSWAFLIRPQRVSPDLIFYDRGSGTYGLIEVKSSGVPSLKVQPKLTSDMIRLFKTLALTKHIAAGRYLAGVILVQVTGRASAVLTSLMLDEA